MKDFQIRNDTKLLFRNNPVDDLKELTAGKKVLFVYGSGSVKRNGCYDDVKKAVESSGGTLYELGNTTREYEDVKKGIRIVKENEIDLIIGAGGASVMDCTKMIAFGTFHSEDLWSYLKGEKSPYGLDKLPLILIPTYPSSGSEYGLGAVIEDRHTGECGTAYGIAADAAVLVPKYSGSLNKEMTAYAGLVTLVQLSASTIGDHNPVSYDIGVSVIRNVLKATLKLKDNPDDEDARGIILYGASLSTSGRLGLGKIENYAYEIYELEFVPEILFGATYRKSLTTLFPQFLKVMSRYYRNDIEHYFKDVFDLEGPAEESSDRVRDLFESAGLDMGFAGRVDAETIEKLNLDCRLSADEIAEMINGCIH